MIRHSVLEHRFVESFPEMLERGVLYVSLEFGSATHSCCCGCGEEVVTPITPTDWNITYDGETVTLHPSVGSWMLPCRSHYVIRHNRVFEAPPWTDEEVSAERHRDRRAKAAHFGLGTPADLIGAATEPGQGHVHPAAAGWKTRLFGWLLGSKA